ncbi:SAM-dependent methyltransferase [Methanocaldococcus villosus KIN24-T80]|uniref:SAM-dependent methyltransferase n=1 Tax=Methanocaldococcus villosus KIN24-T80 TaxID=1069083 RepID=N6VRA0_9EURY|nr:class I SAM-dependent methyltransferase [Methanocaldococcus villosus]ENN95681.1 SAM-dependent methyltransferase [Methanocaldococcus villosus KIN24-T80]
MTFIFQKELSHIKNFLRLYASNRYIYLRKYIKSNKKSKIRLLDVGCGVHSPKVIEALFSTKVEYYGIDKIDIKDSLDKKYSRMRFIKIDLEKELEILDKKLKNNFFDFIMMNHVIEHLENGLEVVSVLCKKLKEGGGFYIEYPGVRSLSLPSMKGTLNFCDDPTHKRIYSIQEIGNVLLKNNFRIIKAGVVRNPLMISLIPFRLIESIFYNYSKASIFWDLFGFAEFIYAIKKNNSYKHN